MPHDKPLPSPAGAPRARGTAPGSARPTRPILSPGSRRLWRDGDTLQFGLPSSRALVLHGAGPLRALLALLDGSRTHAQVVQESGRPDAEQVLDLLLDAGLLLDADDLRPAGLEAPERERLAPDLASLALLHGRRLGDTLHARRTARVVVHGAGRVGGPLAALLTAAGVGTVDLRDDHPARYGDASVGGLTTEDRGLPRGRALAGRLRSEGSSQPPALVVLTDDDAEQTGNVLLQAGAPHLVATVREHLGSVGPLVLPGRSSCLHCVDLTRSLLDPGWPALAAQLDQPRRGSSACDGVLAVAVASQTALQVLELLEGGTPASIGGTLELELPGWRWRRRTWPQHPGCPCAWVDARRSDEAAHGPAAPGAAHGAAA